MAPWKSILPSSRYWIALVKSTASGSSLSSSSSLELRGRSLQKTLMLPCNVTICSFSFLIFFWFSVYFPLITSASSMLALQSASSPSTRALSSATSLSASSLMNSVFSIFLESFSLLAMAASHFFQADAASALDSSRSEDASSKFLLMAFRSSSIWVILLVKLPSFAFQASLSLSKSSCISEFFASSTRSFSLAPLNLSRNKLSSSSMSLMLPSNAAFSASKTFFSFDTSVSFSFFFPSFSLTSTHSPSTSASFWPVSSAARS
mmetsp:Transcript_11521/g.22967  ORF Transcript_11521/g.22967 Transcript_11521/m.22967 type:complete len:263 (+) Transcript_11521:905-1693(+)